MSGGGGSSVSPLSPAEVPSRVIVRLDVGNSSVKFAEPNADGFTHRWTVYVRAPGGVPFKDRKFIKCVIFMLHESFTNPIRVVKEPPFELTECGYGGFTLPIKIQFAHVDKTITINHELCLFMEGTGEHHIEHKAEVRSPTPEFFALVQRYCRRASPEKTRSALPPAKSGGMGTTHSRPADKPTDKRGKDPLNSSMSNGVLKEKDRDAIRKRPTGGSNDVKSERKQPKIAAEKFVPTDGERPGSAASGAAKKLPATAPTVELKQGASESTAGVASRIGAPPTLRKMPRTPPDPEPRSTSSLAATNGDADDDEHCYKEKKAKKHTKEPPVGHLDGGERRVIDSVKKKKKAKKKDLEPDDRRPPSSSDLSERERIAACLFSDDDNDTPSTSRAADPTPVVERERESKKKMKKSKRYDDVGDSAAIDGFQAAFLGKKIKSSGEDRPSRKLSDASKILPPRKSEASVPRDAPKDDKPPKRMDLAASKDISRMADAKDGKSSKRADPVPKEAQKEALKEDRPRSTDFVASKDISRAEKPAKKPDIDVREPSKDIRPPKLEPSAERPKKSELVDKSTVSATVSTTTKAIDKSKDIDVSGPSADVPRPKDSTERKVEKEKKKKRRSDESNLSEKRIKNPPGDAPAELKTIKSETLDGAHESSSQNERRDKKSDKERERRPKEPKEAAGPSAHRGEQPKLLAVANSSWSKERDDEVSFAETKPKRSSAMCRIVLSDESLRPPAAAPFDHDDGVGPSAPALRRDWLRAGDENVVTRTVPNSPCHQNLNAPGGRQASHQGRHTSKAMQQARPHSVLAMASLPPSDTRPPVLTPIDSPISSTAGSHTPSDGSTPCRRPPSRSEFNVSTATTVRISSPMPTINGVASPPLLSTNNCNNNNNNGTDDQPPDVRLRALAHHLANLSSADAMRRIATILIEAETDVVAFDSRSENLDVNLYRVSEPTLARLEAFFAADGVGGAPSHAMTNGTTERR